MTLSEPSLRLRGLRESPIPKSHDYDVRDDQTLPGLQTATNKATAYRHGTLHLR
jgi:hypothetical protein